MKVIIKQVTMMMILHVDIIFSITQNELNRISK
jgi:hypothetical protein